MEIESIQVQPWPSFRRCMGVQYGGKRQWPRSHRECPRSHERDLSNPTGTGLERYLNSTLPVGQVTLNFCLSGALPRLPKFSNSLIIHKPKDGSHT